MEPRGRSVEALKISDENISEPIQYELCRMTAAPAFINTPLMLFRKSSSLLLHQR